MSPGVHLVGRALMEEGAFVGVGAPVTERVWIGDGVSVGTRVVVLTDVSDGEVAVAVSARTLSGAGVER